MAFILLLCVFSPLLPLNFYLCQFAAGRVRIALALKNIEYEYKAVRQTDMMSLHTILADAFDACQVHLVKGEQRSEDYKALNPGALVTPRVAREHRRSPSATSSMRVQVPTLEIDGQTLCQVHAMHCEMCVCVRQICMRQSVAILDYLEDTRPDPPLYPRAPLLSYSL